MRKTFRIGSQAAVFAFMLAACQASVASAETCVSPESPVRVAEVVDSRALRLDDGRVVRLAGIEPFSLLRPELQNAEAALVSRLDTLVKNAEVAVAPASDKPDRYGRTPALVSAGGDLVQETLAREGLAIAFAAGDALPCFDRILSAEDEARREKRGFWVDPALPAATPKALAGSIGHFVIFEGIVQTVGNRRATTYLNFGARWLADVTIEIGASDRERLGGEAVLAALAGRKVRARGFLEEKDGPMLRVSSPMQIEILGADSAALGAAP